MKKRHQQKLILLAIFLFVFLNMPILYIFNQDVNFYGIPLIYLYVFVIWLSGIVLSYIVLSRHYE